MRSPTDRKPSRIYAGSEPLGPVGPWVPIALIPVLIGVGLVRSFCAQHAYELFGTGPRVEVLERAVLWLFAGAIACALAIAFRWMRGLREWGAVPLGFGIGACVFAYVLSAWFGFAPDGTINSGYMDMAFIAPILFGALVLFLSYLTLEFVARRTSPNARAVRALVALPVIVSLTAGWIFASSLVNHEPQSSDALVIHDNSLQFSYSGLKSGYRERGRMLPSQNGVWLYAMHADRLVVAADARDAQGGIAAARFAFVDEGPAALEPGERGIYADDSWMYSRAPDAVVALGAAESAALLHAVSRDLVARTPTADCLYLLSWKTSFAARFQGVDRDKRWMPEFAMLQFDLRTERPAWEVHTLRIDGEVRLELVDKPWPLTSVLNGAARKARMTDARGNSSVDRAKLPPLRLRIHADVSMQEFADAVIALREGVRDGWAFSMVIDEWQPPVAEEPAR